MRIQRDFQPVFNSMVDAFPNCKVIQNAMGQGQKHGYNYGDFCSHGQPPLLYNEN